MNFFRTVKFRLTISYLAIIIVLLFVFAAAAYGILSRSLYSNLDTSLKARVLELQNGFDINAAVVQQFNEVVMVYDNSGALLRQIGPDVEVVGINESVQQYLQSKVSFFQASTSDGEEVRLYISTFSPFRPPPRPPSLTGTETDYQPSRSSDNISTEENSPLIIAVGRSTVPIHDALHTLRLILVFAGAGVILLAGAGGFFLASRALKPVDHITQIAQDIGEKDLSRRINVSSNDELGRLAATLNHMIERLEAAFNRQRQFTADASHELRTPLAIMQAESTLALSKERTPDEYQKSLELISQETGYMSGIIGKLLFLARSEAGKEVLNLEAIAIKEMLMELAGDAGILAREKGVRFEVTSIDNANIKGDKIKLRQLFLNILENAVRYTPAGGKVSLSAVCKDGWVLVSISDTGIGISEEHLSHLFERFYRVDKARSRAEGGAGLGLAISKYIAEAHNGKIEVESKVGVGSTFFIKLPL